MTTKELYEELNYVNHSRKQRLYYAKLIIDTPELIPKLLEILVLFDDKTSCKAAWVFEFMCDENLEAALPYLDEFTKNLPYIHLDSAVRPVAKVCEYLVSANYSKKESEVKLKLLKTHKDRIVEACFDWMISKNKTAPKVYAMQTLYMLGQDYSWIHAELAIILRKDFPTQSAGFKARARHILKKINST